MNAATRSAKNITPPRLDEYVFDALRARDRARPVVFAYESGLVEASSPPGAPGPAGQE
ncbi:hypothetical protein [[Kitasatospora] papulosa]|uniref:hypothetical protein n=1 Tax=[Kitasatospora] papulosa TaxID=1464011 RepID=UPI0037F8FBC7